MGKKKKIRKSAPREFSKNPFNKLKGFAVSAAPEEKPQQSRSEDPKPIEAIPGTFAEEMALLGVAPLASTNEEIEQDERELTHPENPLVNPSGAPSDEELFLQSIGEMQVNFGDQWPEEDQTTTASPRRMKLLKQGKLIPEATLDLHGLQRSEVAGKIGFFLQDAVYQGWRTLLVITGKGLHSEGNEPVLRHEVERFLGGPGRKWVAEWGRAPEKFGGAGALVLFLRKQ